MPNFTHSNLKTKLLQSWYSRRPYFFLIPFSGIYRAVIAVRQSLYRLRLKKITKFSVPIIVIGNLTVGGTGKTPLVIWLVKFLQAQGFKPGVVSRGYGGRAAQYPQWVTANSDPNMVSDEAVLIAQKTNCPMVVDPKRVSAAKILLEKSDCNIVISDDGLQHYAMGRDIEIVVMDGERGFGNEFCLPAGPLREPLSRLQQVDFIVSNGPSLRGALPTKQFTSRADAGGYPDFYSMQMKPGEIYNLLNPNLRLTHYQHPVHAVAGIGNPDRFFASLRKLGFFVVEHPFPDHYLYQPEDLNFAPGALIIMTEKDAVKCRSFAGENFWCLPIELEVEMKFSTELLSRLGPGNFLSGPEQ